MSRISALFLFVFIFSALLLGEPMFVGNIVSHQPFPNRVEFRLDNGKFTVYVLSGNVLRLRYTNSESFSESPSYAVIAEMPDKSDFVLKEEPNRFVLSTGELIVHIAKKPCRISIFDKEMNLLNADDASFGVCFDNDEVRCYKKRLDGENFYGLGEKSDGLRKTGNEYTLWNTDFPGYTERTDELYVSIPFFYGVRNGKAYGIFFDNTYRSHFNFGASNNRFYSFGADHGEMDYYFIYGPEMKRVLSSYSELTGKAEMPPKWAFGYQQCRWSYYPESTVRALADNFRKKQIPCDVIYLDIHYMDGYRVFTWDKNRFPDPPKLIADLKMNGFKVIPIIDPGVKADTTYFAAKEGIAKDLFVKYPDGELYQGEVWPSWAFFPDFTKKETRDWWGEKLSALMKDGVAGFWNDMNEPAVWGSHFPDIVRFNGNGRGADHKKIHNVYALEMAKATRTGLRRFSDQRHFILTRAGFSGIQRYSAVWTGDNLSNEDHLRYACVMSQNLGLNGVPLVGADVGGFMGEASQRLYVRWMQLGAFTPLFRQHSAYGTKAKEPWAFGEDVENTVREIINLRYRILPYLYSEFHQATQTGLPLMRSMFLEFQNDPECWNDQAQFQFMVGENLLVAPVLSESDNAKRLYLPEGRWFEMNTGKIYPGNQWLTVEAPLERVPFFLKSGGILPMQEVQQFVGEKPVETTILTIFPSAKSSYSLYEDDGNSYEYEIGRYSVVNFTIEEKSDALAIVVKKEQTGFTPDRKNYRFRVISDKKPVKVFVGAKELPTIKPSETSAKIREGWTFLSNEKMIEVRTPDAGNFTVTIRY